MIKSYLLYWLKCKKIAKVKHPFIMQLNTLVFSKINTFNDSTIINYLNQLKSNNLVLDVTDLGAGSKKNKHNKRTVKSIAKTASVSPKFGKLLSLLITKFNCKNSLELGTSLGVGTSYMAIAKQTHVYTIEGCPNCSQFTQSKLKDFSNISYYIGDFSKQLPKIISESNTLEFIYIDGNHTYKATVDYFNYLKNKVSKNAIFIFDDIHWSKGMEKAWQEIIASNDVSISIDLFRMGIVFLNKDLSKNHFICRF